MTHVALTFVNPLRSTTHINQIAMCFKWFSYDIRPRSSILCEFWATIYHLCQPFSMKFVLSSYDLRPRSTILFEFLVVELRSTTQVNNLFMFFSVAELRSTTQINQFSNCFKWLSYDQPNRYVFWVVQLRSTTRSTNYVGFLQALFIYRPPIF